MKLRDNMSFYLLYIGACSYTSWVETADLDEYDCYVRTSCRHGYTGERATLIVHSKLSMN